MKRKPLFIGTEMKEIHGQLVEVSVYKEVDPDPVFPVGKLMDQLGSATPEQLEAIKQLQKEHDLKLQEAEAPSETDALFLEDDDFLDTAAENAETALEEYREDTDEEYRPLDELMEDF
jgi:hypothetical protein